MTRCKHCGVEIRLFEGQCADQGEPPLWRHIWPGEPEGRWQCSLYAEPDRQPTD